MIMHSAMRIIDSNSMLALRNYLPEISKYASGNIGGPLSIGFPEPLKMRPSISSDTGVFRTCKEKQHIVTKQTRWQLLNIQTKRKKTMSLLNFNLADPVHFILPMLSNCPSSINMTINSFMVKLDIDIINMYILFMS